MSGPAWPEDVIYPVVLGRRNASGAWDAEAVLGTAFALHDRVVTCWHCVRDVPAGAAVGISIPGPHGPHLFQTLAFAQSTEGHDLAAAQLPYWYARAFELGGPPDIPDGMDVYSYGFPLPDARLREEDQERVLVTALRFFKGYVVRATILPVLAFRPAPVLELAMPSPRGLSGAPVVLDGTYEVVGVVQGYLSLDRGDLTLAQAYHRDAVAHLLTMPLPGPPVDRLRGGN